MDFHQIIDKDPQFEVFWTVGVNMFFSSNTKYRQKSLSNADDKKGTCNNYFKEATPCRKETWLCIVVFLDKFKTKTLLGRGLKEN